MPKLPKDQKKLFINLIQSGEQYLIELIRITYQCAKDNRNATNEEQEFLDSKRGDLLEQLEKIPG